VNDLQDLGNGFGLGGDTFARFGGGSANHAECSTNRAAADAGLTDQGQA
jgi:hypothetical protein